MSNSEKLVKDLEELGSNSEAVADSLKKEGITGRRGSTCACPVAKYLIKRGHKKGLLEVFFRSVHVRTLSGVGNYCCELPVACSAFISEFDDGKYTFLKE